MNVFGSPAYTVEQAQEAGYHGQEALYFATFMNACNAKCVEDCGMYVDDFPDWDWAAAFKSGKSVALVVEEFLNDMYGDSEPYRGDD